MVRHGPRRLFSAASKRLVFSRQVPDDYEPYMLKCALSLNLFFGESLDCTGLTACWRRWQALEAGGDPHAAAGRGGGGGGGLIYFNFDSILIQFINSN